MISNSNSQIESLKKKEVEYFCFRPSSFALDGGAMFGIIPKPLWEKKITADVKNRIGLSLSLLLIKTPSRQILIDTGIGDYHSEKFIGQFLVEHEATSFFKDLEQREKVTDIILSHLHFDHVGGLKMAHHFPNATLRLHRDHFLYARFGGGSGGARDSGSFHVEMFLPVIQSYMQAKRFSWIEGVEGILLEENSYCLRFKTSFGHTPFMVHPYDEVIFYGADLMPTSAHLHPAWAMGYDLSPDLIYQERTEILKFLEETKKILFFEHDPYVWGEKIGASSLQAEKFQMPLLGFKNVSI